MKGSFSLRQSLALRRRLMLRPPCSKKRLTSGAFCLLLFVLTAHLCLISLVPLSWREADLAHVARVIADSQDFPVDKLNDTTRNEILRKAFGAKLGTGVTEIQGVSATTVAKSFLLRSLAATRLKGHSYEYFPEFFVKLKTTTLTALLSKEPSVWKDAQTLEAFKPIMTRNEKSLLMTTFDAFISLCDAAGVTYFLFEASLMGVRRHHGMIPWDDDIDVVVNASQWELLHAVLSSVQGFELFAPRDVQWKFFVNISHRFPDKPFKFPYLDIFFFREDGDFVWAITQGLKHDLVHRKEDIFPLLRRPFEGRLVPVPNNLPLLVDDSHDVDECVTGEYNHKTNEMFYYSGKVSVPCSGLRDVYPFVDREAKGGGMVEETLRVGEKVVHRFAFRDVGS